MFEFIKTVIENPEKFSEDEKLEMLKKVADKKVEPEELAEIVKFVKSHQAIKLDIPEAIDMAGTGGS
jgi:anthranilate phosphoribosyltransferase